MILCKFADTAAYEPHTREWYQKWMTGSSAGIYFYALLMQLSVDDDWSLLSKVFKSLYSPEQQNQFAK